MKFDLKTCIEIGIYDTTDPWCRRCRFCARAPDAHDLRCEAAAFFGLARRAYPDHEAPIGPITLAEHRRQCEADASRIAQNTLMRRVYGGGIERLTHVEQI